MHNINQWLEIGSLIAAQGLKGELRVKPYSEFPERFTKPGIRWIQNNKNKPQKIELIKGRKHPGKPIYIIKIKGIENRDQADSLIGQKILVPQDSRPNLNPDEFHYLDLVGLKVKLINEDKEIGYITDLINGGNDLLELQMKEGKKVLIPFVKSIVPEVNIEKGWLKVSPPPGLLDL